MAILQWPYQSANQEDDEPPPPPPQQDQDDSSRRNPEELIKGGDLWRRHPSGDE